MHDSLTIALLQAREAAMAYSFDRSLNGTIFTEQQWRIVRILAERPSMDFHDLAAPVSLRPSLTGILTRMERDGLVLRLKPVNDQRKPVRPADAAGTALPESARRRWKKPIACWRPSSHGKAAATDLAAGEFIALGVPAGRGDEEE